MKERLNETFQFFTNNFFGFAFLFMGMALIGSLPMLFVGDPFQEGADFAEPSPLLPLIGVVALLFYMLSVGVYSFRFRSLLENKEVSLGEEIAKTLKKALPIVLVSLLYGLAIVIGLLLFILPGIFIANRLSLAFYYVLFNDCGPIEAIKQSFNNTREIQWQLLGGMGVLGLIILAIQIPLGIYQSTEAYNVYVEIGINVLTAPLGALVSIFTLRYFDIVNGTYGKV